MNDELAKAEKAQASLPPGCRVEATGYNRYVFTSDWGVGLFCNGVYVKLASGCCGKGFEWDGRDFLLCDYCLCETNVPVRYSGNTAHMWEDAPAVLESILEQAGIDVLEAALRASVVHELRKLVRLDGQAGIAGRLACPC